jgi:hypothetical protein
MIMACSTRRKYHDLYLRSVSFTLSVLGNAARPRKNDPRQMRKLRVLDALPPDAEWIAIAIVSRMAAVMTATDTKNCA